MTQPRVLSYGQDAILVDLGLHDAPDRASRTHAFAHVLRQRHPNLDIVVGGGALVLAGHVHEDDIAVAWAEVATGHAASSLPRRTHTIPIVFDGPDLQDVAEATRLSSEEIVQSIVQTEFVVELVGFLPGFGYLGPLDPRLVLPRRKAPRPRVPAGSFGIAGEFAGVYPFSSPGGWNLLGRAVGVSLFDSARAEPFLLAPADHIRFAARDVVPDEPPVPDLVRTSVDRPAFVVEIAPACATVQDVGRIGQLHCGMPPSGPLDPDTLMAANAAVGNDPGEAALEIPLGRFAFRALREIVISLDGDKPIHLAEGDRFEVPEDTCAVRYVAFRGGLDVPLVLGSRSTLLVARAGGFSGRPLRKKDVVGVADRAIRPVGEGTMREDAAADAVDIAIDPGPHVDRFPPQALDTLVSSTFTISTLGDRVGVRLEGDKVPRTGGDSALPVPMIRGAMQIATDGTPIVFGPDHPTTGGYPVLAVVRRTSWGALARQRAGRQVRFVLGS